MQPLSFRTAIGLASRFVNTPKSVSTSNESESKAYTCPIYLGDIPGFTRTYGNNSAGGTPVTVYITPGTGVSQFTVSEIANKIVVIATRSGQVKGITNANTTNTMYLQINGNIVTLPVGDVTQAGELFTFTYR
jgi:hypothetical protein